MLRVPVGQATPATPAIPEEPETALPSIQAVPAVTAEGFNRGTGLRVTVIICPDHIMPVIRVVPEGRPPVLPEIPALLVMQVLPVIQGAPVQLFVLLSLEAQEGLLVQPVMAVAEVAEVLAEREGREMDRQHFMVVALAPLTRVAPAPPDLTNLLLTARVEEREGIKIT